MSDELDRMMAELCGVEPDWKWHPRTDIAQAFRCLEKFGTGWFLRGIKDGLFFCCVLGGDAEADTPAEAIVNAIAKALEK